MAAILISRFNAKDPAKFREYLTANKEIAKPYGAELLFVGKFERVLNGNEDNNMVVAVKFPDTDQIDAWFGSDAYQPLIPLREAAADMQMTSYRSVG
jgi:uncharacterized protein (DUF1330 family)